MGENKVLSDTELIPVNIIEEYVGLQVKKTIKELGVCGCNVCFQNACALALNSLAPKYVTTAKGALLTGITATQINNHASILVEVTKAVKLVMEQPHH